MKPKAMFSAVWWFFSVVALSAADGTAADTHYVIQLDSQASSIELGVGVPFTLAPSPTEPVQFKTEKADTAVIQEQKIFFLKTGDVAVPAFAVLNAQGEELGHTDLFTVQVNGPGQAQEELKAFGPLLLRFPKPWIIAGAGLFLALLGLIIYGLVRYSRRNAKPVNDTRTPVQRILDEIRRLEAIPYFNEQKYKALAHLLSDRLKTFLSFTYSIPAEESTTTEVFQRLENRLTSTDQSELRALFQFLDLVKFTDFVPTEDEMRAIHGKLLLFITHGKSQPEPAQVTK
ncbi:MAG: hypothetical protein EOP09_09715 [Proteobacteria bacterium]|nr:MAG: hypothetical protein EOP09_09715 [Pseudomonadota bacterium]